MEINLTIAIQLRNWFITIMDLLMSIKQHAKVKEVYGLRSLSILTILQTHSYRFMFFQQDKTGHFMPLLSWMLLKMVL